MTFTDALHNDRPMRRKSWLDEDFVFLGNDGDRPFPKPVWRLIGTGMAKALCRTDYLAEDWEVMP